MEVVRFTVPLGKDKPIHIETEGFKGEGCVEATKAVEQALGKVVKTELTSEYYAKDNETVVVI